MCVEVWVHMCHRAPGEDDSRELILTIHCQVLPGAELMSSDLMQSSWHHEPLYRPTNFFIADCLSELSKCGVTYQNMAPHPDTSCDIIWLFLDLSHENAWAETGGGGWNHQLQFGKMKAWPKYRFILFSARISRSEKCYQLLPTRA